MASKMSTLLLSVLLAAGLLLASCSPAKPTTPATPTVPTTPTAPATQGTPTGPTTPTATGPEMVKLKLTKLDGTAVEKTVEKPKYGGLFLDCLTAEPVGFDEAIGHPTYAPTQLRTNEQLFQGDWSRGAGGTGEASWFYIMFPRPGTQAGCLAEKWELRDPETVVYYLRKGVRWDSRPPTNGREMTADDVVFSIKRDWQTSTCYNLKAYPWDIYIESVTAPDKWTVIVKCKPGKTGPIWEMTWGHTKIVAPEAAAMPGGINDWRNARGTGAFKLVDYVPGSTATLERNPNYWMNDPLHPENRLPYLDGIKVLIITDASTRLAAMRTAKLDWLGSITWEDWQNLTKTSPQLKWVQYPASSIPVLNMRVDKAGLPFRDIKVRHALSMAIDRQAIVKDYYGGRAEIFNWPIMPTAEWADLFTPLEKFPQSIREIYEYNPEGAKQLLKEAGYPNGFKTTIICTAPYADYVSLIKFYFAKVGVDLAIDVKETGVYSSIMVAKTHEAMFFQIPGMGAIPNKFVTEVPGKLSNMSMVDDPKFNEAYDIMNKSLFEPDRLWKTMKDIVPYQLEQCYHVTLPTPYQYQVWQPWIKGYSGELEVGYMCSWLDWAKYIWVNQDLKKK